MNARLPSRPPHPENDASRRSPTSPQRGEVFKPLLRRAQRRTLADGNGWIFRPEGAEESSPGRQPWVWDRKTIQAPKGRHNTPVPPRWGLAIGGCRLPRPHGLGYYLPPLRGENRGGERGVVLALLLLLLFPALAFAQPPAVSATATTERPSPKIRLSDSIRVTLAIEGPAPLRVELPEPLLAPESDRDWGIQPAGPAKVTPAGENRERWVQVYQLDPFVPGESQTVLFAPLKVNGREIPGPGCEVTVLPLTTEASGEVSRPVTPIEEVPPPPEPSSSTVWWWVANALLVIVVVVVAWRMRRRPKPVPPREWAVAAFDRLERNAASRAALVEGVATVVRGFIDRRFGIPAPKLTTAELLAAVEQAAWPVEQTDPLRRLLDDCDRAKFAGDVPDDDGCRSLLARGREWVNQVSPDPRPG